MRTYELTLVIDPELSLEETKKLIAKTKKIVEDLKGKVGETIDWGKKELAYPIKKAHFGCFFLWLISLREETVDQLDKKIRLEEDIIRYLLVKRDTKKKGGPTSSRRNVGVSRGK